MHRNKQSWRCHECGYRFVQKGRRKRDIWKDYRRYILGRRTLAEVAKDAGCCVPTLRQRFDVLPCQTLLTPAPKHPVNLVIDAVFFGRSLGFLCFCDTKSIVYVKQVKSESVGDLRDALSVMVEAGYRFKSFTLDGKRGFINVLKEKFPNIPVQMCHFHQQAIIRRYITKNPKTTCGQALKEHMTMLAKQDPQTWIDQFFHIQDYYQNFLKERNEQGKFIHKRLRSAFRSIKTNLPHLFLYVEAPQLDIPNTTNHLESRFAHLKEKIKIHRGMNRNRKIKAIQFILKSPK